MSPRGDDMLDLHQHKEYLWKYSLSYGKLRKSHNDSTRYVFPFFDIILENEETLEKYHNEEIKAKLSACSSIEEIYDAISFEYKDFYFMEISSLLHDDTEIYSILLKKTFDIRGVGNNITKRNYEHMSSFANAETQAYILAMLKTS